MIIPVFQLCLSNNKKRLNRELEPCGQDSNPRPGLSSCCSSSAEKLRLSYTFILIHTSNTWHYCITILDTSKMKIAPKIINKLHGQPFTLTCAGPFLTLLHISVHANERAIHATECRRGIGTVSCSEFLPRPTRCGAVAPVTPLSVIALDSFHYNKENRKCFIQGLVCKCLTAFYWFKLLKSFHEIDLKLTAMIEMTRRRKTEARLCELERSLAKNGGARHLSQSPT